MNIHAQFLRKPIQLIKNTSISISCLSPSNNMKALIGMELNGSTNTPSLSLTSSQEVKSWQT